MKIIQHRHAKNPEKNSKALRQMILFELEARG
jgi:hypothetical protein